MVVEAGRRGVFFVEMKGEGESAASGEEEEGGCDGAAAGGGCGGDGVFV